MKPYQCPKCRSRNVTVNDERVTWDDWVDIFRCETCGFEEMSGSASTYLAESAARRQLAARWTTERADDTERDERRNRERYYAVNDRPVKIMELPDGGADALVFDWTTGGFIADRSYFARTMEHGKDVDQFTKEEFDLRVVALRLPILARLNETPLLWEHTGDGVVPYRAKVGERTLTIRVNDFPAEALYTLLVDGEELEDLEDWPPAWVAPEPPHALLDKLGIKKQP